MGAEVSQCSGDMHTRMERLMRLSEACLSRLRGWESWSDWMDLIRWEAQRARLLGWLRTGSVSCGKGRGSCGLLRKTRYVIRLPYAYN